MEKFRAHQTSLEFQAFAPAGISIGCRLISEGDEDLLLPSELVQFERSSVRARRQSGAARALAREMLETMGHGNVSLVKARSGAALWPSGIVGSLAHDDDVAVAAIGRATDFMGIGIDVEPSISLPSEIIDTVTSPEERNRIVADALSYRVIFACKEAIFKAVNPLDGVFLDFHDIDVDLARLSGITRTGYRVTLAYRATPHVVALAFIQT